MASFEFKLPDIGEGIVEGEIVKWLVKEGDEVAEDQPMVEVMTDKATVVIPSPRRGRVTKLHGAEGQIAKVHKALVTLEIAGEGGGERVARASAGEAEGAGTPVAAVAVASGGEDRSQAAMGGRVLATPVTRRIAREHGVNLAELQGSGPQGRVLKTDVLRAVSGEANVVRLAPAAQAAHEVVQPQPAKPAPAAPAQAGPADQRIPLRGLRRAIAKKMVTSKFTAPHYTFVEELDATELKALRRRLNDRLSADEDAVQLSFLPFILKACAAAMRKHPTINANFDEAAQELVVRGQVNIGVAVSTDEGLTVPVIKDVRGKSLRQLAEEIPALAGAAREKRIRPEDLTGGTFTVSSLGEQGGLFATPIINHPEVAILGVHRMRPTPVVRDGTIQVRDMMHLSLSFDHRVVDGAVGAAFTYEVIRYLQDPELLMLEMV